MISFDALNPTSPTNFCMTVKTGAGAIYRPNGSGEGQAALSRTIDSTAWGTSKFDPGSCNNKSVSGMIDFARSSGGPTVGDAGTDLTYVPFARDGVSFAYATNGVASPVTSLTQQQLNSIFTQSAANIPVSINGVNIYPCGIQSGSGTFKFWNTVTGASATQEDTATSVCNAVAGSSLTGGRVEENNMSTIATKASNLPANSEVIVGFSAGSFVAQSNGVAKSTLPASGTFGLGAISDNGSGANLGAPYTTVAGKQLPSSTFYADTKFGRNIYYVLDTLKATAAGNTFLAIKNMFISTVSGNTVGGLPANYTAQVCSSDAQTTINSFGFLSLNANTCGNPTLFKGSKVANP